MREIFYFYNDTLSLIEVKTDQYYWLLYNDETKEFKQLTFKSMDDNIRIFEEGMLKFNDVLGSYNKKTLIKGEEMPLCLRYKVLDFLKITG